MEILVPQTLVKVGWIEEKYDLIKVLRKVNPRFQSVDSLLGNSEQCELFDDSDKPYDFRVSRGLLGHHPEHKYNSIITISSYSQDKNQKLYDGFCKKTGMEFRDPPKSLEQMAVQMTLLFIMRVERI